MNKDTEKIKKTEKRELELFKASAGSRIRFYREQIKMSQEELANKVGLSNNAISNMENGKTETSFYKAAKCSEVLGASLDEIAYGITIKRNTELRNLCYIVENEFNKAQQDFVLQMMRAMIKEVRKLDIEEDGEE